MKELFDILSKLKIAAALVSKGEHEPNYVWVQNDDGSIVEFEKEYDCGSIINDYVGTIILKSKEWSDLDE